MAVDDIIGAALRAQLDYVLGVQALGQSYVVEVFFEAVLRTSSARAFLVVGGHSLMHIGERMRLAELQLVSLLLLLFGGCFGRLVLVGGLVVLVLVVGNFELFA